MDNNTTSLAHTPTPWHVLTTPIECLIRAENFEETFQNIAATPGLNGNAEANAAFIVRACNVHEELLAAAVEVIVQYDASPDGPLGKGFTNGPFLKLREAVAKTKVR